MTTAGRKPVGNLLAARARPPCAVARRWAMSYTTFLFLCFVLGGVSKWFKQYQEAKLRKTASREEWANYLAEKDQKARQQREKAAGAVGTAARIFIGLMRK
jgi:hypothetical protein